MKPLSLSLAALFVLLTTAPSGAVSPLRSDRLASLETVFYRQYPGATEVSIAVELPGRDEKRAFKKLKKESDAEAIRLLDELYWRSDLKALALRDSDGDGTVDFWVSDSGGKFGEGDIDVDGDGVRNIYDSAPFDAGAGGKDTDGDGIPDVAGTFLDANANGLPDHLDWAIHKEEADSEMAEIQLGLFRDFKIILVERTRDFDLDLAQAADDAIRLVFRSYFEQHEELMPTLRTIATEDLALLNEEVAVEAEDGTNAQVFSQTQTLLIYDRARHQEDGQAKRKPPVGLVGVMAHEMGHSYQFSLDFAADNLDKENRRNQFPAAAFLKEVEPFGWTTDGWGCSDLAGDLEVAPLLFYWTSEPNYLLGGETREEWEAWLMEIYESLDDETKPEYLQNDEFVEYQVVSDYSLTTPWEWHGENLLAYLIYSIEEHMRDEGTLKVPGLDGDESEAAAEEKITLALRDIWWGFYHRNIAGTETLDYFKQTFPITEADLETLAKRYLEPILVAPEEQPAPEAP